MFYTPASSFNQVDNGKRLNKKWDLASLPVIDPYLISIAFDASRLIDEMDRAFTSISNAPSNDGSEVTILKWAGGIPSNPYWSYEERLEIDGAFNVLIGDTFDKLMNDIREWHFKATRVFLGSLEIFHSRFKIEPPIEIIRAVQALNLSNIKRKPLEDMLELSQRQRYGMAAIN